MIDTAANSLPQVRAGTINAYALTAKTRLPAAPETPTVDEAGRSGLYALNWQAVFVPKGTPKDVVTRLNFAVVTALADPTAQRRLADIGQEIFSKDQQTPQALATYQKAEVEKWWPIVPGGRC
jgi:tripartite-type tricarboxylate transporter receptor subunit TctC